MRPLLTLLLTCSAVSAQAPPPASSQAPVDYDFDAYNHPEFLRNIYLGRVSQFWELESILDDERALESILKRNRMNFAYLTYHNLWSERCAAKSSEPLTTFTTQLYIVTTVGGIEVGRTPGSKHSYNVRTRFSVAYSLADGQTSGLLSMLSGLRTLGQDIKRLLDTGGCSSKAILQFEENLHRVYNRAESPDGPSTLFAARCVDAVKGAGVVSKPAPQACSCFHQKLRASVSAQDLAALEDDFSWENLLMISVSRLGLHQQLAGCIR